MLEFEPKSFLYDELKYYKQEDDKEALRIIGLYKDNTLSELIEYREHIQVNEYELTKKEQKLRLKILRQMILHKLEIVDLGRFGYFLDVLQAELNNVYKEIESIKKFKDHRHKTVLGLYTEKANY